MAEIKDVVQQMIDDGKSHEFIQDVINKYNTSLGKEVDPANAETNVGSENDMVSNSEIGSSDSAEELTAWQSISNSMENLGEMIWDIGEWWFSDDGAGSAKDLASNGIYKIVAGRQKKGKDGFLGFEVGDEHTIQAIEAYKKEQEKTKQTLGVVESWKKGDVGGVLAGSFNAITNMLGSVAYGAGTFGGGFLSDFIANNYVEYNKQKAQNLGISLEELIKTDQADAKIPVAMGVVNTALESIVPATLIATRGRGAPFLKMIPKQLTNKIFYSKNGRDVMNMLGGGFAEFNTEILQHVGDEVNSEMGRVAGTGIDANPVDAAIEALFSEEGLEAGIQGFLGGGGIVGGGSAAKSLSNIRSVVDGKKVSENIDKIGDLRIKLKGTKDATTAEGIQKQIDVLEQEIADSVRKGNKIYSNLSNDQLNEINSLSDLADAAAFKITELHRKKRAGVISESEFETARVGFEKEYKDARQKLQDMKLEDNIKFVKDTVSKEDSAKGLKTTVLNTTKDTLKSMEGLSEIDKKKKQEFRDNSGNIAGFTVGGKIFINKEVASEQGQVGVAGHEFLHKILNAKVGDRVAQAKMVKEFRRSMTWAQRAAVDQEMKDRGYANTAAYDTEYVNVFSDMLAQERINYDKSVLEKIGDSIVGLFKGEGFDNISFKDGRGVYNFMKAYGKSMQEGKLTEEAKQAIGDVDLAKKGDLQFSKEVNPRAQQFLDLEIDNKSLVDIINSPQSTQEDRFGAVEALIERNWPVISNALKFDPNGQIPIEAVKEAVAEQMLGIFPTVTLPNGNKVSRKTPLFNTYNPDNEVTTFLGSTLKNRQAEIFTRAKAIGGVEQMGVDISEAKNVKAKETKKDTSRKQRKQNNFNKVIKNVEGEPFYNKKLEGQIKNLITSALSALVKLAGTDPNPAARANRNKKITEEVEKLIAKIEALINKDITDKVLNELGPIKSKKVDGKNIAVIPDQYMEMLTMGFEDIIKAYPVARLKKLNTIFSKQEIGVTDKKNLKKDNPLLKKDSYYRKVDHRISKPLKATFIKYFTQGGLTTLRARQKQLANDMAGNFVQIELGNILNDTKIVEGMVKKANLHSSTTAVIQVQKLIQDIQKYLDPKVTEKMDGDIVQFSKTAHSITRGDIENDIKPNKKLIPKILSLITEHRGSFITNFKQVDNYIEKTIRDILVNNVAELGITKEEARLIAREIGSEWKIKDSVVKAKKYNVEKTVDFLIQNVSYNLKEATDMDSINAKLGLKNEKDFNSRSSLNDVRQAVKWLFDSDISLADFIKYIYPSVYMPARLAGFKAKGAIKNILVKASELIEIPLKKNKKGKMVKPTVRDSIFANAKDAQDNLGFKPERGQARNDNTYKHGQWYVNEDSDYNNLDDNGKKQAVKEIYEDSKAEKDFMLDVLLPKIKEGYDNGNISLGAVQWLLTNLFANQFSPGKVMAGPRYLPSDKNGNLLSKEEQIKQGLAYKDDKWVLEHMSPANYIRDLAYLYVVTGDKTLLQKEVANYDVAIIPQKQDDALSKSGRRSKMGINHKPGDSQFETRYDDLPMYMYDVVEDKVIAPSLIQYSKSDFELQQKVNKAIEIARDPDAPHKGISIFDFDDTLAYSDSKIIVKMPDNTVTEITPAEFAVKASELEAQGAEFDFKQFNEVINGKPGPLVAKLRKAIGKFGNKHIFILTARPQQAAPAIYKFMKELGLEIPIENITGLEDGRPDAKAEWVIDKAANGYNDFYFVDDAYKNVEAVQKVLEVVDVNHKVKQVQFSKYDIDNIETNLFLADDIGNRIQRYNTKTYWRKKLEIAKVAQEAINERSPDELRKLIAQEKNKEIKDALKYALEVIVLDRRGPNIDPMTGERKVLTPSRSIQYSKSDLDAEMNNIIYEQSGVNAKTNVSDAAAKSKGSQVKNSWWMPPGAEDFVGLMYMFMGKGEQGNNHYKFFKETLFDPFSRAIQKINQAKQIYLNGLQELKKLEPVVTAELNEDIGVGPFTVSDGIRVYVWNKLGYEIPGISKKEINALVKAIENNAGYKAFGNGLIKLTKDQGYTKPDENWTVGNVAKDINDITMKQGRKYYLKEWIEAKNIIFSKKNLNKIESIYGTDFREALEDMLWRMENGTNRKFGNNKLVNRFSDWVNNSVGAIMFFNMRSAVLQTISMVNFVNWSDNNPLKAAAAVANWDQYVKDFVYIFNSDMLKQRRAGLQTDVNEAEIASAVKGKNGNPTALLRALLRVGFTPTQLADSFAIASGGATMYRNRINTYLAEGMSQAEAEKQAFQDFADISEATQQSARPDMISMQQAGPLGRLILAFQNTPMQYMRLSKKAFLDLKNGRGDAKTNISKLVYYSFVQNLIFTAMQSALFAVVFEEDEEEKDKMFLKKRHRIMNNMMDTILRGGGVYGAGVSTLKNILLKFKEQEDKGFMADHTYTVIEFANLSPPIGSKLRRVYSGIQEYRFNKDIMAEYGFDLRSPAYNAVGNVVSGFTNVPLDRVFNKLNNVRASLNNQNATWQRIANFMGWNTWDLGSVADPNRAKLKEKVKKDKLRDKSRNPNKYNKSKDEARKRALENYKKRKK